MQSDEGWVIKHIQFTKLILTILLSITYSTNTIAAPSIRGVYYDPAHSFEYLKAVGLDDLEGMQQAVRMDLAKLAALQDYHEGEFKKLNHLRTQYTLYDSAGIHFSRQQLNLPEVVHAWNESHPQHHLTLALGVYEYTAAVDDCVAADCLQKTKLQLAAAIQAANDYGINLIDRIIVGNPTLLTEDVEVQWVRDVLTIKSQLKDPHIKVGIATSWDVAQSMFDPYYPTYSLLRGSVDFVAVDLLPFWKGYSYAFTKTNFLNFWRQLKSTLDGTELIVGAEGWPSDGSNIVDASPQEAVAKDYFYYWYFRGEDSDFMPASYYYALFDALPGQGLDQRWGIYSADGAGSLIEDAGKVWQAGHVLVTFDNDVTDLNEISREVEVNACTEDWNPLAHSQGLCYPLYGFPNASKIAVRSMLVPDHHLNAFLVDTTGETYKSLLITFDNKHNHAKRLCYIDFAMLKKLRTGSLMLLTNTAPERAVPCWMDHPL